MMMRTLPSSLVRWHWTSCKTAAAASGCVACLAMIASLVEGAMMMSLRVIMSMMKTGVCCMFFGWATVIVSMMVEYKKSGKRSLEVRSWLLRTSVRRLLTCKE